MKKKLQLNELQVKSFVTEVTSKNQLGGVGETLPTNCCTAVYTTIGAPCPTIDKVCNSVQPCLAPLFSIDQCPTLPVNDCI